MIDDYHFQQYTGMMSYGSPMQQPDSHRALKSESARPHLIDMILSRLKTMFSLRPVVGNIIGLMVASLALYYIFHEFQHVGLGKLERYAGIGIQIFAAIQIIKSGARSLALPVLAAVIGTSVYHSLGAHEYLLHFPKAFYQYLMVVGVIGMGISVLSID